MARVGIIQSNYIPWKGYFDIIHDVDTFVFYDDVQFTKNDWRNRNKIKTSKGPQWLSVPCGKDLNRLIFEVQPSDSEWQKKHWLQLKEHYSSAPHFKEYSGFFEDFYLGKKWTHLSEINQYLITHISRDFLGIKTKFEDSRQYSIQGKRLERLIELLKLTHARLYVSGPSARDYIEESAFAAADIQLEFKSYAGYPEYPQLHPPFTHEVSILDLLFNVGKEAPYYIWGWREGRAVTPPSA